MGAVADLVAVAAKSKALETARRRGHPEESGHRDRMAEHFDAFD